MNWNYDNKIMSTNTIRNNGLDRIGMNTTPVLSRPTLTYGDQGEYVTLLQNQLKALNFYNGAINSNFDDATLKSVREFQTVNRLTSDGVVNNNTWSALIYLYSTLPICGNYYTVQPGDTLYSIARKYNTTVAEIKRLNNLTSDTLSVGQQLTVPGTTPPPPTTNIYTVARGDTLWSIASRFNTTVDAIKNANNLKSNTLTIGQQLTIPGTSTTPPTANVYTVVRGDTLWSIASRFNTTVDRIKSLNNLTSNVLNIGQVLKIPS